MADPKCFWITQGDLPLFEAGVASLEAAKMKKIFVIASCWVALSASLASAQPGIDLAWDNCGLAGVPTKSFDCASNSGFPFVMVASYIPPSGINQFLGIASQIDVTSTGATLPAWWQYGIGFCRGSALAV